MELGDDERLCLDGPDVDHSSHNSSYVWRELVPWNNFLEIIMEREAGNFNRVKDIIISLETFICAVTSSYSMGKGHLSSSSRL
jgi:hypothetical protein